MVYQGISGISDGCFHNCSSLFFDEILFNDAIKRKTHSDLLIIIFLSISEISYTQQGDQTIWWLIALWKVMELLDTYRDTSAFPASMILPLRKKQIQAGK